MRFQTALLALATSTPALLQAFNPAMQASELFTGQGTVYTLSDPNNGNCNFMSYPRDAVTKYAALNTEQWTETKNCGRCAEVTCIDAICAGKAKSSEVVYIVDQCPGCAAGDLDLAPGVFAAITGLTSDRLAIQWKFVDCPVTSNVKYCLKKGSNPFWAAIQPTNFASGIASVEVNGQSTTMVDSAYYFLLDGKSNKQADLSRITIAIVGVNGEKIQDTVSFAAAECVEGRFQFTGGDQSQQQVNAPAPAQQTQVGAAPTPSSVKATVPAPVVRTQRSPSGSQARGSSSSGSVEVSSEADRVASEDTVDSGLLVTSPSSTPTPAPDSQIVPASIPPASTSGDASTANTEASGRTHKTSPAVVVLTVFGCVAGVVLAVLAAYVNKKKVDDKRADHRLEGSGEFAVVSIRTNGSFCQVTTPAGRNNSGLSIAVL